MATNKQATFSAMNEHFLDEQTGRIDENWLNTSLYLVLDNNEPIYNDMHNAHIKAHAVAWNALLELAKEVITYEEQPTTHATSEQLKAWLKEYGRGYDSIADAVSYVETERAERKAEQEANKK